MLILVETEMQTGIMGKMEIIDTILKYLPIAITIILATATVMQWFMWQHMKKGH